MKKQVLLLAVGVLSLTLFSFKPYSTSGVSLLANGNYLVPEFGILSTHDVNQLEALTVHYGASETDVFHKEIDWLDFSETVTKHKEWSQIPDDPARRHQVDMIMTPYLDQ